MRLQSFRHTYLTSKCFGHGSNRTRGRSNTRLTGVFLIQLLLIALFAVWKTNAQIPVYTSDLAIGGTAQHTVIGNLVPNPGVPILLNTRTYLADGNGHFNLITHGSIVLTTGNDGHFESALPCYTDANGIWHGYLEADAYLIGSPYGPGGWSAGTFCTEPYNSYSNSMGVNGDTNEPNIQNTGPLLGAGTCVGEPVNVTNGNMWLQQSDYDLPGLGESLKVNRFYNSVTQQNGMFGYGWTSEYEESLGNYNNTYLRLMSGTGRGIYFAGIGNNTFDSASAGFYGQVIKNADNTYTLTFKDGRVHKFGILGQLLWQKDRNGNQTTLNYDTSGVFTGVTDPAGRTLSFTFGSNAAVSQISDALGSIATYEYFAGTTRLKTVTYPDGSRFQYEYTDIVIGGQTETFLTTVKDAFNDIRETHAYDSVGRATTSAKQGGVEAFAFDYSNLSLSIPYTIVTDGLGRVSKYYFDRSKGRNVVTQTVGVCGCGTSGSETTTYQYDGRLNLVKKADALSNQTVYTYNSNGDRLSQTDVLGIQSFTYNGLGEVLTSTDRMAGVTTNTYSAVGNLLTTTDALNNTTTLTYTSVGQLYTLTDALNHITTLTYDSQGRLIQISDANGKHTNFGYDSRARMTSLTNALSQATSVDYDLNNRPQKITFPDTNFVSIAYDLAGRRTSVTDELGHVTTYGYDGAYRVTSITDALSNATSFAYDLMSNLTSQTDALGNITNLEYDDFNRLKKLKYPLPIVGGTRLEENYTYDNLGNIKTRIDTASRTTNYDYDSASRLITITDALNQATHFQYNARSQMTKVTDAVSHDYLFTFDALGRGLSETRAGTTMSFVYDAIGNRTARTDHNGAQTNYTYDVLNRLTGITYSGSTDFATYGYDDLSRLISAVNQTGTAAFTYDNRNRRQTETDVFGHVIEYVFDAAGNRTALKLDSVSHAGYVYDAVNRLTQLNVIADSSHFTFGYDAANRVISKSLPNKVSATLEYDGMSRLKRLKHLNPSATLYDDQYSYNTANQIGQIAGLSQTKNFIYDNIDRLTGMTDGTNTESYAYDSVGNRTSSHRSATYTTGIFNRLTATATTGYSYNANGDTIGRTGGATWNYGWDREDRMTSASAGLASSTMQYDALGRRVKRTQGSGVQKYSYDGQDVILDDFSGTLTKYQNGPGIDNKLEQTTSGTSKYFLQNHLGSSVALTDSSGAVTDTNTYDSFGNATNLAFASRYQYTGREYDATTGLQYSRARWYDPNIGRFISEDPIGLRGGDVNIYSYVFNNPVMYFDPEGEQARADSRWDWSPEENRRRIQEIQSIPFPIDTGRYEKLVACHERNKFSTLGSIIPYGQGALEILETGSILSLGADGVATWRKFKGPATTTTNPLGSGINMAAKDVDRAMGFPKIGGSPLGKFYRPVGNKITPFFWLFAAGTFSYNTTVDVQCICGILD